MRNFLSIPVAIAGLASAARDASDVTLLSSPGSIAPIKGWSMQSTIHASEDMITLSKAGADVSSWYRVGSYGTVMVCP